MAQITDRQRNYIFALLKQHDLWASRIGDMDLAVHAFTYHQERSPEMLCWDWIGALDMQEASEVIEYLTKE